MELQIRYKRSIGIALVLASITVALDSLVVGIQGQFPFSLFSGFVTLYGGILFLKNPYFRVSKHELVLYKLIGQVDRTYSLKSWQDLSVENDRVYWKNGNDSEKIPIYKWLVNEGDWETLKTRIQGSSQS
ncbi:MAG: hypothetical protein J7641_17740 [Cyanobacteria bacterium SID2]|nr:hypothetical protein [Cyanobacteria bacterium SID2]MBP0003687.1 hypothetical protein [Cyanobacteria bacterium SBC]